MQRSWLPVLGSWLITCFAAILFTIITHRTGNTGADAYLRYWGAMALATGSLALTGGLLRLLVQGRGVDTTVWVQLLPLPRDYLAWLASGEHCFMAGTVEGSFFIVTFH